MTSDLTNRVRAIVLTDVDNTLWDTNEVFAAAQLALLGFVEKAVGATPLEGADRLAFVRSYDQALAERHHAGLRYPVRLLIGALALGLKGFDPLSALRVVWCQSELKNGISEIAVAGAASVYREALRAVPSLRPGVRLGLQKLRRATCRIIVVTESSKDSCLALLGLHRLDGLYDQVVSAPKHPGLYCRLAKSSSSTFATFMIGDQPDRDIRPAREAGLTTLLFRGGFTPKWAESLPDAADYEISSFDQAADIICQRVTSAMPNHFLR
jgi:putative hydrolase of the HAD superfamily